MSNNESNNSFGSLVGGVLMVIGVIVVAPIVAGFIAQLGIGIYTIGRNVINAFKPKEEPVYEISWMDLHGNVYTRKFKKSDLEKAGLTVNEESQLVTK